MTYKAELQEIKDCCTDKLKPTNKERRIKNKKKERKKWGKWKEK